MYFKLEDNILSVKALNRAPGHNFLFTLYCLSFESWLNLNLQVYLQYIVKCASKWGCDKAGFCWNSSNWIPIKATIFTPIHNLGHHPDPDAMLSCFFILLISTSFILFYFILPCFCFPSFFPLFCAFPHSLRFRSNIELPQPVFPFWNGPICVIRLDSGPSSPLHFSIAVFYPSALPAFESKAGTAYTHLSLAFKKLYFFSSAEKHV